MTPRNFGQAPIPPTNFAKLFPRAAIQSDVVRVIPTPRRHPCSRETKDQVPPIYISPPNIGIPCLAGFRQPLAGHRPPPAARI